MAYNHTISKIRASLRACLKGVFTFFDVEHMLGFFSAIRSASRSKNVLRQKPFLNFTHYEPITLKRTLGALLWDLFNFWRMTTKMCKIWKYEALEYHNKAITALKIGEKSTFMVFCHNWRPKKILSRGTFETGGFNICST